MTEPPYRITTERYVSLIKAAGLSYEDIVDTEKTDRLAVLYIEGPAIVPIGLVDGKVKWALILPPGSGQVTDEMWQGVLTTMEKENG